MRQEYCYDLHGVLKIASNIDIRSFAPFTGICQSGNLLSVRIDNDRNISSDTARMTGLRSYYIENEDGVYLKHGWSNSLMHASLSLKGLAYQDTILKVNSIFAHMAKYIDRRYELKEILESLICVKLLQKEFTLLHSACVANSSGGVLIAAFANTGKTRATMVLCKNKGFNFLSDDYTVINNKGDAFSFPSECDLSMDTYKELAHVPIGMQSKLKLELKSRLLKCDPGFFEPVVKVPIDKILPRESILNFAPIRYIVFLEKGVDNCVEEIDKDSAIQKLTSINNLEIPWNSHPLVCAYAYFNGDLDLDALKRRQHNLISNLVNKAEKCFVVRSNRDHASLIERISHQS